ncbi:MAG: LPS assembly lipoprotein LptE [Pseudomonadota bacterium]
MSSSERLSRRRLLGGLALLPLAGCGFEPVYGEGAPAATLRGGIAIGQVEGQGRAAFFMRERLERRFGDAADPAYTLDAAFQFTTSGLAITQDNDITRFNMVGTATWRLTPRGTAEAAATGDVEGFTAYSATASVFATRTARRDAEKRLAEDLAERIAIRVAVAAREVAGA